MQSAALIPPDMGDNGTKYDLTLNNQNLKIYLNI